MTAAELYALDLRASLITLSACETGLSVIANGDELVGLLRGFFFAAMFHYCQSLKVDDLATLELMKAFLLSFTEQ